jgi:YVTN family beta-propeller protein
MRRIRSDPRTHRGSALLAAGIVLVTLLGWIASGIHAPIGPSGATGSVGSTHGGSTVLRDPNAQGSDRQQMSSRAAARPMLPGSSGDGLYVKETLDLLNNTLHPGNFLAQNGIGPGAAAYDSAKGEIFVISGSNTVTVLNAATNAIVTTIAVGIAAEGIAYDSGTGEIFVTNSGYHTVSVVSDTTDQVVANISVGSFPYGLAYDSVLGEIFVTNSGSSNVSVIDDVSDTVVATIAVGTTPEGIVYDPGESEIFVANYGSGNVSVVRTSSTSAWASILVGTNPEGIAYDSGESEIFVANNGALTISVISDLSTTVVATFHVGNTPGFLVYASGVAEVLVTNPQADTVSVISDSNDLVHANVSVGRAPNGLVYDSANGKVFVSNVNSGTLSVINTTTNTDFATVPLGYTPDGVAYDSGKGEIFVSETNLNNVSVVDAATNAIVATVPVGDQPEGIAYDSGKAEVFVSNTLFSNSVSIISDATNTVVHNVTVSTPGGLAYDPSNGRVFVANDGSNTVNVISDSTNTILATIPVGSYPDSVVYDSGKAEIFVSNVNSNNVSVINAVTYAAVAQVPVGTNPEGMTYDSGKGEIFVANSGGHNATVISDATNHVVGNVSVGAGVPVSVAYDHAKALVLITNEDTNNVSAINDSTNQGTANFIVGANPVGVAYDPAVASAYVSNYVQGTLTIISPGPPTSYNITFTETGLPSGTTWGADLDGTGNSSAITSVGFTDPNGTYPFTITPVAGFTAHPSTGNLTISGAAAARTIVFLPVPTYNATFVETGLPLATNWGLSLNGTPRSSNTSAINFTVPNGTYAFAVGQILGFQVSPSQGNVSVAGSNVSQALTFLPIPTYSVTFNEAGLPSGTSWGVTLNGTLSSSATSSIVFVESNGTYPFTLAAVAGYTGNQTSGDVVVLGLNVSEGVTFVPAVPVITQYSVLFTETGLPSGTNWGVILNGSTSSSTVTTVSFTEPNGSYAFSVLAVAGFDTNLSSGQVQVDGAAVSLTIAFVAVVTGTYTLTFAETGLPSGTTWTVTLEGTVHSSTSSDLTFTEPNGTYSFEVGALVGYTSSPLSGSITVHGLPVSQSVAFQSAAKPTSGGSGSGTFLGLPADEGFAVLGGIIAAAIIAVVAALLLLRRGRLSGGRTNAPPPGAGEPPGPT